MKIRHAIVSFPLRTPFSITGHTWTRTDTLRVTLEDGDLRAHGEAVGSYYLDETPERMAADLERCLPALPADPTPEQLQELMPPGGARNALDCALWDLRCKRAGRSIWDLLDLQPKPLTTVFTIGIEEPEVMADRARAATDLPHLKIKLDGDRPMQRLAAVRAARPEADLVIDVNQGWTFDELRHYLPECQRLGVAMIEQPLPRGADRELEGFTSPVPLGADESCLHLGEFAPVPARYDVLNIKLDKCGGLTEALALVRAAQAAGLDLMVGNMTGSSLSMAPAFVIGQYCRYVDIDGPLLQAEDVDHAMTYGPGGVVAIPDPALWG